VNRRKAILLFILCVSFTGWGRDSGKEQPAALLGNKYSVAELQRLLIPPDAWTPFPRIDDRSGWAKADAATLQAYIETAEDNLNYDWPAIPATLSLLIVRTGNRYEYQSVSYKKRALLAAMMIAELAEDKGRFIDPVINGIWSICEESWWGVPAHIPDAYKGLMDVENPRVELYVAVTGALLSWVDYFLGTRLDAVSPQIRKRIRHEVHTRLLRPLMTYHHRWMGRPGEGAPNNWNPWICSNWLTCALLLQDDAELRAQTVAKILTSLDHFLDPYPADGGCSEGPHYWNAAAGALYDNLSLLNLATQDAFRYVFADEKIKHMARFIYRMHIGGDYFLNFADAPPRIALPAGMVYRFGKDLGDDSLMRFGACFRRPAETSATPSHFMRNIFDIFRQNELQQAPPQQPLPQNVWLPNLQIAAARDHEGTTNGFYVAVKGGHNGESHNHNDVGNYIVYYNGQPLLIDVGTGRYTAATFGPQRYEIWNHRSDFHNTPTINGAAQGAGSDYRASEMHVDITDTTTTVSLHIAEAYPDTAAVQDWKRTVALHRNRKVTVLDESRLKEARDITLHLMTCYPATVTAHGALVIHYKETNGHSHPFTIDYDSTQMNATVEKITLETDADQGILANWSDTLYRINFHIRNPKTTDNYQLTIQ
jgi:hypothetical protein